MTILRLRLSRFAVCVRSFALALAAGFLLSAAAFAQNATPVVADGAPDMAHPARMLQMEVQSHGATMFGVFYAAAGAGPHPTVLLLHGFPGYEQNIDLAQAIRRAGWNVFTFHYRGAWGSHGTFSFTHAAEDTMAMLAYLRAPENAKRLGVDAARIVVIGHSMGGFMATHAAAHDRSLAGAVLISPANMSRELSTATPEKAKAAIAEVRSDIGPLAGCTVNGLLAEVKQHSAQLDYMQLAPAITRFPVLVIEADDDELQNSRSLAAAMRKAGNEHVDELHLAADHAYSGNRIALETAIVEWLDKLPK